jgi:hypothetical protein
VLLSNPTDVVAKWTVSHVPGAGANSKVSSIRVKGFNQNPVPQVDDPSVFTISPNNGQVIGPTVSPSAAMYCPPNDVNRKYVLLLLYYIFIITDCTSVDLKLQ